MKTITTTNFQQMPANDIFPLQISISSENTSSQEETDQLWEAALNTTSSPKPKSHLISEQDMEL